MARNENMIAALKRERATYVAAGDEDRIRQVDESLKHYGYDVQSDAEQDGPQGRSTAPQQTADAGPDAHTGDGGARPAAKKTTAKKTATQKPAEPPAAPAAE